MSRCDGGGAGSPPLPLDSLHSIAVDSGAGHERRIAPHSREGRPPTGMEGRSGCGGTLARCFALLQAQWKIPWDAWGWGARPPHRLPTRRSGTPNADDSRISRLCRSLSWRQRRWWGVAQGGTRAWDHRKRGAEKGMGGGVWGLPHLLLRHAAARRWRWGRREAEGFWSGARWGPVWCTITPPHDVGHRGSATALLLGWGAVFSAAAAVREGAAPPHSCGSGLPLHHHYCPHPLPPRRKRRRWSGRAGGATGWGPIVRERRISCGPTGHWPWAGHDGWTGEER